MSTIMEMFERHHETEFLESSRLSPSPLKRLDLRAFMLLDRLCPGKGDMVCAAEHDEIWLAVGHGDLEGKATEADVIELIRCGVRLDKDTDSFAMFV